MHTVAYIGISFPGSPGLGASCTYGSWLVTVPLAFRQKCWEVGACVHTGIRVGTHTGVSMHLCICACIHPYVYSHEYSYVYTKMNANMYIAHTLPTTSGQYREYNLALLLQWEFLLPCLQCI